MAAATQGAGPSVRRSTDEAALNELLMSGQRSKAIESQKVRQPVAPGLGAWWLAPAELTGRLGGYKRTTVEAPQRLFESEQFMIEFKGGGRAQIRSPLSVESGTIEVSIESLDRLMIDRLINFLQIAAAGILVGPRVGPGAGLGGDGG